MNESMPKRKLRQIREDGFHLWIYLFGNPLVDRDSLPLKLLPQLKRSFPRIEFVVADPNEDLFQGEEIPVIIDTVVGIDEVTTLRLSNFASGGRRLSLHDYDLGTHLFLKKKLGEIEDAVILGLPMGEDRKRALEGLESRIRSLPWTGVRSNLLVKSGPHRKYKGRKL